jgi:hypothetical protein
MKTRLAALAVTAILATSAVAKTQKIKATHVQPNHTRIQTSAVHHNDSHCGMRYPPTDPDPQVRSQLLLDCKNHESEGSAD